MSKIVATSFTSYALTEDEFLRASMLSSSQQQVIQNELANAAEQILNLEYDPSAPLKFVQDDSFLKGQLSVLRMLLIRSEEAEKAILTLAQNS